MDSENEIETINLEFCYRNRKTLENISFHTNRGLLGIIGPNGSGKTTFLRCLNGFLKPEGGSILLRGRDINRYTARELARMVGSVPQDTTTSFEFTVLETVLMGRKPHQKRLGRDDAGTVKEYMELTGCWDLAERPITELSGGELRRVIIARALAQEPEILLLDEPTAHLDINHQFEIMELLKTISTEKIVIAALHDLGMAARYCSRLTMLDRGIVIAEGSAEEVLTTENVRRVFGIKTIIRRDLPSGSLIFYPISEKKIDRGTGSESTTAIHLICGGGSGSKLMTELSMREYKLSCGVLNIFDVDCKTAEELGLDISKELAFSAISDGAYRENIGMIKRADLVLLTDFPVGMGNLRNVEAAEEALDLGKRVIIVDSIPLEERDFSGRLEDRWIRLRENGAIFAKNEKEALDLIL